MQVKLAGHVFLVRLNIFEGLANSEMILPMRISIVNISSLPAIMANENPHFKASGIVL